MFHCVLQEELKITYLINAVEEEQKMNAQEQELKSKLEGMVAHKVRKPAHGVAMMGFMNIIYSSSQLSEGRLFNIYHKNVFLLFIWCCEVFKSDGHSFPSLLFLLQQECETEMEKHEEEVRLFQDTYDRIVDEDGVCWLLGHKTIVHTFHS